MRQIGHLKAPKNWINDPNGFIYYKGMYHMFYQYFPYGTRWGTMHWGHAVSKDLVSWEHKGLALFPTRREDQNGCFSGGAVEHDGKLYLYYTGVHYNEPDPMDCHCCLNDNFDSCQLMISSDDGMHFDNFKGKRVVIPVLTDKKIGDRTHTRDPKVWRGKNAWYMVLGSKGPDGKGKLLFYRSSNLKDWEFVNDVTAADSIGWMWECPDYFETKGGNVLIISPMGNLKDGKREENQTVCGVVGFEEESCTMSLPETFGFLDYGLDLYAPQSTVDAEGRRVLVAWLRMPEPVDGKWIGMHCLPRVVEVKQGHIYFRVHPNVKKLYSKKIASPGEGGESGYRVSLTLREGESADIGGYRIFRKDGCIWTDRSAVYQGLDEYRMQVKTPTVREGNQLDIYVDSNMIEVYVNDGEYVISNTVYEIKKEISINAASRPELFGILDQEEK